MITPFITQCQLLFLRECMRVHAHLSKHIINNWLVWPILFACCNGYFMPVALFDSYNVLRGTELFIGILVLHIFVLSYVSAADLLSERVETKVLGYHMQATSFRAVFFARLAFYIFFTFSLMVPFFPVAKLVLRDRLYTALVHWPSVMMIIFLGICLATSYILCWVSIMERTSDLRSLWNRGIDPFLWLGGGWAPGYAVVAGAGRHGWWVYLNPFIYISDSLRSLFLGDTTRFVSMEKAVMVLLFGSLFFATLSYHLLKRRMDVV